MKQIFTYALAATVSCCTVIAHAQSKILATEFYSASSETATTFEPLDASNAYDNDLSTYAVMRAIAQLILPPFDPAKSSEMEIGFDETIPGGTPITLAFSELSGPGLLSVLLGGTLGSALNAVLFATAGNPQIEITVLDSDNNPVVNSSYGMASIDGNAYIGPDGLFYITITPPTDYNHVNVVFQNITALPFPYELQIGFNGAFVYENGPEDPCNPQVVTSIDALGISVDVLELDAAPIQNPHYAIDNDPGTYSSFGYGGLISGYVGSQLTQNIYYNSPSSPDERATITFGYSTSLLDIDLLNNLEITLYNGGSSVYSTDFGTLLGGSVLFDIISISLGEDIPATVTIPYAGTFDRIEINYTQLVEVSVLSPSLRIYSVNRGPISPTIEAYDNEHCADASITLNVEDPDETIDYVWRNTSFEIVHTGSSYATSYPADGISDTLLVEAQICGVNSEPMIVILTGNEAGCLPSQVEGNINLGTYESPNPLFAVVVDPDTHEALAFEPVNAAGEYTFDGLDRGNYHLILYNDDITIGNVYASSQVDDGFIVDPDEVAFSINGLGEPVTLSDISILEDPLAWNDILLSASRLNQNVLLQWSVIDANRFVHYSIERSIDGKEFQPIYQFGPEALQAKYTYLDEDAQSGPLFYQIKAREESGKIVYSAVVRAPEQTNGGYALYPNPSKHQISLLNYKGDEKIQVFDVQGRHVTANIEGNNIDISTLTPGMYILRIFTPNNQSTQLTFQKL